MGGGESKIFNKLSIMLDEYEDMLEMKKKYVEQRDTVSLQTLDKDMDVLTKKIRDELSAVNKIVKKEDDVESFQFVNRRFQYYLNKNNAITFT
jgi:hypothetical protein